MGRALGIDYGRRRVGVALADPTGIAIEPLGHIPRTSDEQVSEVICALITEHAVDTVVVGLPLHAHGDAGEAVAHARRFAGILERACGLTVYEEDERHSSSEAEGILRRLGEWPAAPGVVDARAAGVILRRFLDRSRD